MFVFKRLEPIKTPLVNKFYAQHSVRGRAKKHDAVWVAYYRTDIVAACRVQNKSEFLLLSTLFVDPFYRGCKVATGLLSFLLQQQSGTVYTFAYKHALNVYYALGFSAVTVLTPDVRVCFDMYKHRDVIALNYTHRSLGS